MTPTGREIREARTLLGPRRSDLAAKVGRISTPRVRRAEEDGDGCALSEDMIHVVRQTLEQAGVEFHSRERRRRRGAAEKERAMTRGRRCLACHREAGWAVALR